MYDSPDSDRVFVYGFLDVSGRCRGSALGVIRVKCEELVSNLFRYLFAKIFDAFGVSEYCACYCRR